MEFKFDFDNSEAFANVRKSFYELCDAEKALKKARRRARIVRTIEKTVVITTAVGVYKAVKNHNEK